jgi:hypothetical protein
LRSAEPPDDEADSAFLGSTTQQQAEDFRPKAALTTAAAQPTPAETVTAPAGQLVIHAPHSMQASGSVTRTRPSHFPNTPWGHTSMHTPHPPHFFESKRRVVTPRM